MDDITFVRSHWWLVSEVFHYRPPTPMYRNSPPLCTIVLQIPSLMPLEMRKVQLTCRKSLFNNVDVRRKRLPTLLQGLFEPRTITHVDLGSVLEYVDTGCRLKPKSSDYRASFSLGSFQFLKGCIDSSDFYNVHQWPVLDILGDCLFPVLGERYHDAVFRFMLNPETSEGVGLICFKFCPQLPDWVLQQ